MMLQEQQKPMLNQEDAPDQNPSGDLPTRCRRKKEQDDQAR